METEHPLYELIRQVVTTVMLHKETHPLLRDTPGDTKTFVIPS